MSTPLRDLVAARLTRRAAIQGIGAAVASAGWRSARAAPRVPRVGFAAVADAIDTRLHVPAGYRADVLLRWGDPILPGAPAFDPRLEDADAQAGQFGYNCDFIVYRPLDGDRRGLLCVNHEYTSHQLMWPDTKKYQPLSRARSEVEMAAHGHSVVEVRRNGASWEVVPGSRYARRITARDTRIAISGPAAGHPRLRTADDPTGREVIGTLGDCAGGVTPWGTVLIAEENFHKYFGNDPDLTPEARNLRAVGIGAPRQPKYAWFRHFERFDVVKHPREANRFGWVLEYDPTDPSRAPVKRTALGRRWHECATCVRAPDGRLVVYGGDDAVFQHLYRFVTRDAVSPDRAANRDLLDHGTLSVARFEADGTLRWLPLVFGQGPLTPDYDFHDVGDVLIESRRAAKLLGATPLDRPEDVEVDPVTGRVYVMLTDNTDRAPAYTDAVNPRGPNRHGHVLELVPPTDAVGVHHEAPGARWEILLMGGEGLANPDNAAFDRFGRLWIATDGAQGSMKIADGLWHCGLQGAERGRTRRLLALPAGAECCGPCFTPDARTLFVSVQHPGEGGRYSSPSTRWPDFDPKHPPRPSVVAITHRGGEVIGA